jgi:adenylate cyclase
MSQTRRLAAILAADVAGYSRLIGDDEEGTLGQLKAIRAEIIDPKIVEHHGRVVKTTGDGLLVEFASVVDGLRCATEWQQRIADRNAVLPHTSRIEFRIGINVGDVVVEDGDIFGDGVNVAARLEGLADPGGICVSTRVKEDVAGKLDLTFEDMGEQSLKNIARPVRVYRVTPTTVARTQHRLSLSHRSPRDTSAVGQIRPRTATRKNAAGGMRLSEVRAGLLGSFWVPLIRRYRTRPRRLRLFP